MIGTVFSNLARKSKIFPTEIFLLRQCGLCRKNCSSFVVSFSNIYPSVHDIYWEQNPIQIHVSTKLNLIQIDWISSFRKQRSLSRLIVVVRSRLLLFSRRLQALPMLTLWQGSQIIYVAHVSWEDALWREALWVCGLWKTVRSWIGAQISWEGDSNDSLEEWVA